MSLQGALAALALLSSCLFELVDKIATPAVGPPQTVCQQNEYKQHGKTLDKISMDRFSLSAADKQCCRAVHVFLKCLGSVLV